ncbi:hypothetical protein AYJ54_32270 [Bradyrhizobium centrolobii]|uniref:Uncharacterized protein n=1 Tax=Bradyrhizobium centrolobii TaxID=1505087 RepID=A0A176YBL5_9BRAD|nr:hypothetical protein [Bradyrhizobium centrolobii]OAE99956.1 hypothetical protein AYJ54_32270 [Bradyrhizobium centrolobii]
MIDAKHGDVLIDGREAAAASSDLGDRIGAPHERSADVRERNPESTIDLCRPSRDDAGEHRWAALAFHSPERATSARILAVRRESSHDGIPDGLGDRMDDHLTTSSTL